MEWLYLYLYLYLTTAKDLFSLFNLCIFHPFTICMMNKQTLDFYLCVKHSCCVVFINTYINSLTPELNPSAQRCLTRIFTEDFPSRTMHFVNICVKTNKYTNYLFSLLIIYGSSYMFRHYIAIFRERS
jgi:hypothetical protein